MARRKDCKQWLAGSYVVVVDGGGGEHNEDDERCKDE